LARRLLGSVLQKVARVGAKVSGPGARIVILSEAKEAEPRFGSFATLRMTISPRY
jgi:hypothetical protein